MTLRRLTATFGLLAALAAMDGARPGDASALQAGFRSGADADTFTVSAEGGALPKYSVRRTGAQELTVTFDSASGEKAPPAPGVGGSRLVSGVRPVPGGFKVLLKTSAFGYVNFPVAGKSQLQIQIFPDAIGSQWSAGKPDVKAEPKQDKKSEAEKKAEKQKQDQTKAEAQAKREQEAQAKREKQEEAHRDKETKAKAAEEAKRAAAQAKAPAPPSPPPPAPVLPPAPTAAQVQADSQGQPFFSVPYSMRAPVNKTVIGAPSGQTATLPPVAAGQSPAAPAVAPAKEKPVPEKHLAETQKGGRVPPGVVEKPLLQEQSSTAAAPRPPDTAPPAAGTGASPPVDVAPAKGHSQVRFRADRRGPEDARPAEVLSGAPASAKSSPSLTASEPGPPPQAQPTAAQAPKAWEVRQPVQKTVLQGGTTAGATLPQVAAAPAEPAHGAQQEAANATNASGHAPAAETHAPAQTAPQPEAHPAPAKEAAKDAHGNGKDSKEPKGPLTAEQLKDQLLKAQSDMVAGKWTEAAKALEDLLREPNLKGDTREEALYALADSYMQAYKDSLAANYDKVAGAQQTAMNANQKSMRVPRVLVNLGLLSLKVGNLPEAKAYFNIIKKKYAHDQNAATIPFALGEYYRAKGDLAKAAEQYQILIQNYPDSRMAKDTAFILAQTLRKLGNFEKAFQIVDYLDKRWPLFYMENPGFLKLAAEVEEKVGKLAQAKDHYWTFYNLNPDNEFADITLVRIGDIYLRQDKRPAAKEVYQKALRDFPDREGGLVARMRLAEEGVYDDPTMSEMGAVFGKPDSLKPNETYELIIAKYPQSPLAPLAQIKLGMWQFHTKSYLDAMNTATSFLEKYPKSPLTGKAKELGFQAFLQALPRLVQDGNYARVVQLFDTSPFVKENQDKIGDEAQMAIAVSAWKRGQPDRALKLAGRFLGKRQVPKYSEMALDLAMNIFLERKEWSRISDLATRADAAWKLSPRQKAQFERARAMALENQGETEKSIPLWTRIASDASADPATRAYATYVLAKDAARKQDMHRLFALSQEALTQLLANGGDRDKIKDCLLMAITATERSGRYEETLKWGREFDRIIPDSDPDWAPVRLRLADIYRKGNQLAEWKALLEDIVKKKPNTVYARMAGQALESSALDKRLQNYLTKTPR